MGPTLWIRAFALTVAVEVTVAYWLLGVVGTRGRRLSAILVGNLMTHPIVWFVLPRWIPDRATYILVAESWAVLGETWVYWLVFPGIGPRRAFGVSAVANALSYLIGLGAAAQGLFR